MALKVKKVKESEKSRLIDFVAGVLDTKDSVVLRLKTDTPGTMLSTDSSEFLASGFLAGNISYIRVNKAQTREEVYTLVYSDGTFEIWDAMTTNTEYRKHMQDEIRSCIEDDLHIDMTGKETDGYV